MHLVEAIEQCAACDVPEFDACLAVLKYNASASYYRQVYRSGGSNGLPGWLRSVLHCSVNFISNSWYAAWKTGRGALYSVDKGQSLQALWQARAPGGVQRF